MDVTFATTIFAPVVLGFFGLGTGYLIYGPQELFDFRAGTRLWTARLGSGVSGCQDFANLLPASTYSWP
jgi:hypothetical protein